MIESKIIGAIINDGGVDTMPFLEEYTITPDFFTDPTCRRIYTACIDLYHSGDAIDEVSICLHDKKITTSDILPIADGFSGSSEVAIKRLLPELKSQRQVAVAKSSIARVNAMIEDGASGTEIAEYLQTTASSIESQAEPETYESYQDAVKKVVEYARRRRNGEDDDACLTTQYAGLNQGMRGFKGGLLYVLCGKSGTGKTAFVTSLMPYLGYKHDAHVLFFSMEMTVREVAQRVACGWGEVNWLRVEDGMHSEKDQIALENAMQATLPFQMTIDPKGNLNYDQICARTRRIHNRKRVDMVIIDHWCCMKWDVKNQVRDQEQGAPALKALAKDLEIPTLVLTQPNKEGFNKDRLNAGDMKGSQSLMETADTVIVMNTVDEQADHKTIEFNLEKNRGGVQFHKTNLAFIPRFTKFVNDYNSWKIRNGQ